MGPRSTEDVLVAGGGVIGLAIADRAARAGLDVTVVDPRPGRGATWAAAGMLAPVAEAAFGEEDLTALNLRAARAWPGFAAALESTSGRSVGFQAAGTLLVGADRSDRAAIGQLLAFHGSIDLASRPLDASACRAAEPLLMPGIAGGAELGDDHQVDNRRLVEALLASCAAAGVRFQEDEVGEVGVVSGRVAGVALRSAGRRRATQVVLAAGCRTGEIGGVPERDRPPVRPVKGMTLRLGDRGAAPRLARTVRGIVHGRSCYLVPRSDGTLVVGATVEERGFDSSVQAGPLGDLLDAARTLVPAVEEYELLEAATGLRPGSPDNAPVVGATTTRGLFVATGHYRHGILLAPVTAASVVARLTGAPLADDPFARFPPGRFATPNGAVATAR